MEEAVVKNIAFGFHPYNFDKRGHCVEKAEGTKKRRYLVGISSGSKFDQQDERMTDKCIKSMLSQGNSGDILLYPDVHGIKASEDIGKLILTKVLKDGDWYTEYKLYDEEDGIGPVKAEKIDTIWKQMNGLPPYKQPIQKGFSIEGYIPPEGIISAERDGNGNISKRVIDDVRLDGVCLVPRQAYKPAVAMAVYKALGELNPYRESAIRKGIKDELTRSISDNEIKDEYYKKRWDIQDVMDRSIERVMSGSGPDKKRQLEVLFEEYQELMVDVILKSESIFLNKEDDDNENIITEPFAGEVSKAMSKIDLFRGLELQLDAALKILSKRM